MTQFNIAGIQLDASATENSGKMSNQVDIACARFPSIEMIVFGELCTFGTRLENAQPKGGPAEIHFCALAKKHGIWLIPGSMYELCGDQIFNSAVVINPAGEIVTRCRKLFPFEPFERGITGGDEFTTFEVPGVGIFGVSICYDMWFPETTRTLVAKGAEIVIHPTLTNTLDREVELSIARANAAINQCYFFDINNTGELGYGRSIIASPEGKTLHQAGRGQELMPVNVDFELVRRVRENGSLGLGQLLKSFRDAKLSYPVYEGDCSSMPGFSNLGPLEPHKRPIR